MNIEDDNHKDVPDEQSNVSDGEDDTQPPPPDEQHHEPDSENSALSVPPDQQHNASDTENETPSTEGQEHDQPEMELEPASMPQKKRGRFSRRMQLIAALLVVICLFSGALVYALAWHSTPAATTTHGKQHEPAVIQPLKITNWCVTDVARPDPKAGPFQIVKIAALSAKDAWLLGSTGVNIASQISIASAVSNTPSGFQQTSPVGGQVAPVLEHWDGRAWSIVPTADTTALVQNLKSQAKIQGDADVTVSLHDMVVLADNNIWLVGGVYVTQLLQLSRSGLPPHNLPGSASHTLIEHWDGSTWQIVASPDLPHTSGNGFNPLGGQNPALTSIAAVSANNIWAVGAQMTTPATTDIHHLDLNNAAPLAERWDGGSWQIVPLPATLPKGNLQMVQAISANDIWAFGVDISSIVDLSGATGPQPHPVEPTTSATSLAAHWDGQQWSPVTLPPALSKGELSDEAVISTHDIWVIGNTATSGNQPGPSIIQHWDGSQWSDMNTATLLGNGNRFSGIYAQGAQDIWLLGQTQENEPLTEHWDGKAWSKLTLKTPAHGAVLSMAVAGNKAWALVNASPDNGQQSSTPQAFLPLATQTMLETNC